MKVLVTGGAGFIGSHVAEEFSKEFEVVVLDNLRTGKRENLKGIKCQFVKGSITDLKTLREVLKGVDFVVHLAALVSVEESMKNPEETFQINLFGTLKLFEESAKAGVKRVVFASSAAVYGDLPGLPKKEEDLPAPKSPYAITKLDGEHLGRIFSQQGWLEVVSLRFFNVYGPRQDPHSPYAAAIPIFTWRAVCGEPIKIYGTGRQTRDFIFVKDVVKAVRIAIEKGQPGEVYNVGTGHRVSVLELANLIKKLTGSSSPIKFTSPRPGDVMHSVASISKIKKLGFRPEWSLEEGLVETIEFFRRVS